MTAAAILLAIIIGAGVILYIHHRLTYKPEEEAAADTAENVGADNAPAGEQCCGMHITCEKDSLVAGLDRELLYYDDEELDAFKGRAADSYTPAEADMFREVLFTLRPDEIAGWARSITTRGITLPADVRDELLLIVAEARAAKAKNVEEDHGNESA